VLPLFMGGWVLIMLIYLVTACHGIITQILMTKMRNFDFKNGSTALLRGCISASQNQIQKITFRIVTNNAMICLTYSLIIVFILYSTERIKMIL
jgi:uncharacterized membrane protein